MDFDKFILKVKEWGEISDSIDSIILVGSYARGDNTPDSDIDLCILTSDKEKYLNNPKIFSLFGKIEDYQLEDYGKLTSIRVWYNEGFEVEYGITDISWIDLPLDSGTREVLSDGYKVIVDKKKRFCKLQ